MESINRLFTYFDEESNENSNFVLTRLEILKKELVKTFKKSKMSSKNSPLR